MLTFSTDDASILQNLKDAGCSEKTAEQFFELKVKGKIESQLKLLSKERSVLLQNVHVSQKKLDCLDYLIYCLKKNQ